jgi:cytochrome P450
MPEQLTDDRKPIISPYVLHQHRLLWRDPDLFDPSRFFPGAASAIER